MTFVAPETFKAFICHWYSGDEPPFVGVALKVIGEPAQIVFPRASEAMLTLTGITGFTIIACV